MAVKTKVMVVEQRPLLKEGDPGYDPKRRLLNMAADPIEIGRYDAWEECTLGDLIEELGESAVADAARRQYNTDRRNAIASDHLNGGASAAKEAEVERLNAVILDASVGLPEKMVALEKLKQMALKPKRRV